MAVAVSSAKSTLAVMHVAAPGSVGGLERVVQSLAIGHARRGHDISVVSVLTPDDPSPHPFAEPLRKAGVEVHEVRCPSRAALKERRAVGELMARVRPQVVHTHGYRPDILHATTARALSIPTVTTEHGTCNLGGKTAVYEWVQRKLFRRFQAVIAVSSPIARTLLGEGVPEQRLHLIPNAWAGKVDFLGRGAARKALGLPEDRPVIGYVARLISAKGPDVFVDAMLRLGDLPVCGALIGEGTERPRLEAAVADAGARDRVLLLGEVADAATFFRAFDLFVLSSRTEGTPIALLEALAAGVPTVVTSVGGVPDVVSSSEAVLVPPEDPAALAAAIRAALADGSGSERRARMALLRLEREFGADEWLGRHEDLYRSISAG